MSTPIDLSNVGKGAPPTPVDLTDSCAITLHNGLEALIDIEDHGRVTSLGVWTATLRQTIWYATKGIRGKTVGLHHFVSGLHREIDHINGNGLDNRKSNLRPCTRSQNGANRTITHGNNRYRGVYKDKTGRKWVAQITVNRVCIHLGTFVDQVEAAQAYDRAAKEYFGEFARTNF